MIWSGPHPEDGTECVYQHLPPDFGWKAPDLEPEPQLTAPLDPEPPAGVGLVGTAATGFCRAWRAAKLAVIAVAVAPGLVGDLLGLVDHHSCRTGAGSGRGG